MLIKACIFPLLFCLCTEAQDTNGATGAALKQILQRLDSLEQENKALSQEVRTLREELRASQAQTQAPAQTPVQAPAVAAAASAPPPTLDERVGVNEQRIDEQAQTKVESSQKLPLSITGMLLFNAFANSRSANTNELADLLTGPSRSGATLRQTLLGLQFQGPQLPGGGRVHGDIMMDFFGGSSYPTSSWLRIRRGVVALDWTNRSITVGQDKPLIAPRAPESLAEVGVPALAGAGNLWSWLPQIKYEERLHFGSTAGLTPQVAIVQTGENYAYVPAEYASTLAKSRPGIEGRLALWYKPDDQRRFEIAPGFHASTTHVAGASINSRAVSLDWLATPWQKLQFSGAFFHGQNLAPIGGLPQGFTIFESGRVVPIHGTGGWVQLASNLTSRLTLHLFAGQQQNRAQDLVTGDIQRNVSYAANLMYRIGPNVILGVEALQMRSRLIPTGDRLQNHYDLSVAYLF